MGLRETIVYEQGERVYLVAPLAPASPQSGEIEEFAFGRSVIDQLRQKAPNEHIAWFGGHYVEADIPNGNGAMWTGRELAIKSLTPMLCPVTVMHDPRTAVGLIADTRLRTPDADKVPRAKIETALAVWKHRFPGVVEEAHHNYTRGTLYQSMECFAPEYSCQACGMGYTKLPRGAERANWCDHLLGKSGQACARILGRVTFTGTGLIFGSRGARGADPQAHLEAFQEEVAEFHQRVHRDTAHRPRRHRMDTREIAVNEYDELRARPERSELDAALERAQKAERDLEAAETAKVKAESERDEAKTKLTKLEEQAAQATLRDRRLGELGGGFLGALGDKTKDRLRTQAATLQDEEWSARLEELEELTGRQRDVGADGGEGDRGSAGGADGTFSREEIARFQGRSADRGSEQEPTPGERRSVLAGL